MVCSHDGIWRSRTGCDGLTRLLGGTLACSPTGHTRVLQSAAQCLTKLRDLISSLSLGQMGAIPVHADKVLAWVELFSGDCSLGVFASTGPERDNGCFDGHWKQRLGSSGAPKNSDGIPCRDFLGRWACRVRSVPQMCSDTVFLVKQACCKSLRKTGLLCLIRRTTALLLPNDGV